MLYNFLVSSKETKKHSKSNLGFGLIELMVSIGILTLVMGTVLTKQSAFNGSVLLRSQAYEVAFALREIQLSAVSASGNTGDFTTRKGIHFDTSNLADNQYLQFEDNVDVNGFYDAGEDFGAILYLDDDFEIREIRLNSGSISGTELSVLFERPNFDAMFFDAANNQLSASTVYIDISKRGNTGTGPENVRTVEVTSTGQISVY